MLIDSLEELRETAQVAQSGDWATLSPFVQDAQRFYLERYVGRKLIKQLEERNEADAELLKQVQRVLGPLAYMLATHESSISFGDAGHVVKRTNSVAPASDAKIRNAQNSAEYRGWENLDYLLAYLEENKIDYPEWESSLYCQHPGCKYFRSAFDFQTFGMVDIAYSRLTFEKLLQLIRSIEATEVSKLVDAPIAAPFADNLSADEKKLVAAIQPYIAFRVAALHTSQTTREQRTEAAKPEYKPVIRPLYTDRQDTGNYYAEQAAFWKAEIIEILAKMGIDKSGKLNWNAADKNLFCDIA